MGEASLVRQLIPTLSGASFNTSFFTKKNIILLFFKQPLLVRLAWVRRWHGPRRRCPDWYGQIRKKVPSNKCTHCHNIQIQDSTVCGNNCDVPDIDADKASWISAVLPLAAIVSGPCTG